MRPTVCVPPNVVAMKQPAWYQPSFDRRGGGDVGARLFDTRRVEDLGLHLEEHAASLVSEEHLIGEREGVLRRCGRRESADGPGRLGDPTRDVGARRDVGEHGDSDDRRQPADHGGAAVPGRARHIALAAPGRLLEECHRAKAMV